MSVPHPPPARLRWTGVEDLEPEILDSLFGTGAPFEMGSDDVAGHRRSVFVAQPPDLRTFFEGVLAERPDQVFLIEGDRSWTFAEAWSDIEAISSHLHQAHGVGPGDHVAFAAANSAAHVLAIWAVLTTGAVAVGLNGWWNVAEMGHGIALAKPTIVFGDGPRLRVVRDATADSPHGAVPRIALDDLVGAALGGPSTATGPVSVGAPGELSERSPGRRGDDPISPDDPALVLFTSGTTGRPKAAMLSHRNLLAFVWSTRCSAAIERARRGEPSTPTGGPVPTEGAQPGALLTSPLFHISGLSGMIQNGPSLGIRQVIPPPGRWDERRHLELTARHRLTSWNGVPTQYLRLLRHPDLDRHDLRTMRSISSGGAPFPTELVRLFAEKMPGTVIGSGYGLTETAGLGTRIRGDVIATSPGAVGVPGPTVEIEIRDAAGRVVPEGVVGEIHVSSPSIFSGYLDDPEASSEVLLPDGWLRTGDHGRIVDGRLMLESRIRDLIIRGGENIHPLEIENRLMEHPAVAEVAVIGVDDEILGQRVRAVVVPEPGTTPDPEDLRSWVGSTLAAFKVPAEIEYRDSLPQTSTGKVLKHVLEEEAAAG